MGGIAGGGGGGKGGGTVTGPGGLTGADIALAGQALGQNVTAIHNRYQQLGLGVPAAGGGANPTYGSPSTMEQMDIGTLPTESGGAEGAANALTGELFNPVNAAGLGAGGPLQQLAQQQQQDQQAGFAAGSAASGFGNLVNSTG